MMGLDTDASHRFNTNPRVRLSAREIESIHFVVHRLLGDGARIRIFGSRARLDEKGGDIDLLIETEQKLADRVLTTCRLTSQLQLQLGDQKIDVIIIDPETREQPIHQIARQTGVIL
ncbi:nucleotidyltransferase domain-containing protein [Nitrosomonas sp. Is35]|uniref:nucleotidyltransferase domain-containing protein n=1 Tax=unclassified Nitrosomonas TaxID=2609265 RepID=UPI00294A9F0E|nr:MULTISPECIES: nucleotidyltransferase domain-containing protein [unclassified Nitrosomonas]MDV6340896.1 nucleotidyltransferase domain-containing protein [Nitrosomonas sp. Is24]MDV6346701.1 nucleotidyltransferase domain-containing protein [Nitrosomonas sp. Is35]